MILVCGNFGGASQTSSGQIIKTINLYQALVERFGADFVLKFNTSKGIVSLFKLVFLLPYYLSICKNVVILPAHNGIRIIVPLLKCANLYFRRRIHYVVIGGWLPDFLSKKPLLTKQLRAISGIYVETISMKEKLNAMRFNNVFIVPNFKQLQVLNESDIMVNYSSNYRFCTFSRVMKEKGIEDAIAAVMQLNEKYDDKNFFLDIYGNIEENQEEWFDNLQENFPDYILYKGGVPSNQSVNVLKNYFALLFPTYYEGEGLAGTLLDAMAAGLPVICSDWKYNKEIVKDYSTGLLFHTHDVEDLKLKMEYLCSHPDEYKSMRMAALRESEKFTPTQALSELFCRL